MKTSLVILLIQTLRGIAATSEKTVDFNDHCLLKCVKGQNVACTCYLYEGCTILDDNEDAFMTYVVDGFNKFRNGIALQASIGNMRELHYDYDLELLALCVASRCRKTYPRCIRTFDFDNLEISTMSDPGKADNLPEFYFNNLVEYSRQINEKYGSLQQWNWTNLHVEGSMEEAFVNAITGTHTHFGCYRSFDQKENYMVCVFGSELALEEQATPLKFAKACSQCGTRSCSSRYSGLCS